MCYASHVQGLQREGANPEPIAGGEEYEHRPAWHHRIDSHCLKCDMMPLSILLNICNEEEREGVLSFGAVARARYRANT